MKFLVDESVDRQIVAALRRDEHMVLCVTEMNPGISDDEVLGKAEKEPAILITTDKDFGELVFRLQQTTNGVILVRLAGLSSSKKAKIVSTTIKKTYRYDSKCIFSDLSEYNTHSEIKLTCWAYWGLALGMPIKLLRLSRNRRFALITD